MNQNHTSVSQGQLAEISAQEYLQEQGLQLVIKNYRCKGGEIDLIMQDGDYRVFIEVRLRRNPDFGSSLETITPSKQSRIIRAAKHYLQDNNLTDKLYCRFDAVGIDADNQYVWIKDAFQVQY